MQTSHHQSQHSQTTAHLPHTASNPCTDKLTDIEYLEHMIPHHQVAIDMSHALQATCITSPTMLHLCRNIVRKQDYEIWEMTMMKQQLSTSVFYHGKGVIDKATTKMKVYNPYTSNTHCNPLFFDPDTHHKHMQHQTITIQSYLKHMIPHHQVAVNMSERLLLHTNHSYLMDFCRKLIVDQQYEITTMNDLLKHSYLYESCLV